MAEDSEDGKNVPSGPGEDSKPSADGPNLLSANANVAEETGKPLLHAFAKDGVFAKIWKVGTGKNTYETENVEPDFNLLKPSAVSTRDAMAYMKTGASQVTVRGDAVSHYVSDRLRLVDGDDTLYVQGAQLEQVKGRSTLLYLDDRRVVISLNDVLRVWNNQDIFIQGESTEQYVGIHDVTAPEEFELKQIERGFSTEKLDMALFGLDLHTTAADFHVVDVEGALHKTIAIGEKEEAEAQHAVAILMLTRFAIVVDIVVRFDILVDVGVLTPFR